VRSSVNEASRFTTISINLEKPLCGEPAMSREKYRYVPINDDLEIPVPVDATPQEEAEIVARFKKENPPEKLAAELEEWWQLLRDHEEGKTITGEELLARLEMQNPNSPSDA
jgi:hypothetical protein